MHAKLRDIGRHYAHSTNKRLMPIYRRQCGAMTIFDSYSQSQQRFSTRAFDYRK